MTTLRELIKRVPGAQHAARLLRRPAPPAPTKPEGQQGFQALGHREYVGGYWDLMQRLQFDFMVANCLKPEHHLYDIACGSLRAGAVLIPYLNAGHYHGMDRWQWLLDKGVAEELCTEAAREKTPDLIANSAFAFELFSAPPDFALAQSLFTHLPMNDIERCLRNLRKVAKPTTVFFASFLVVDEPYNNAATAHDHANFYYTSGEMEAAARRTGWRPTYIGDWKHPTPEQVMMRFDPA